jgi:hypothetical protein
MANEPLEVEYLNEPAVNLTGGEIKVLSINGTNSTASNNIEFSLSDLSLWSWFTGSMSVLQSFVLCIVRNHIFPTQQAPSD